MKIRTLEMDGWEKRGVFDEPRLSEICQLYEEAGYEVLLVEFDREFDGVCSICFEDAPKPGSYKVVYTRK